MERTYKIKDKFYLNGEFDDAGDKSTPVLTLSLSENNIPDSKILFGKEVREDDKTYEVVGVSHYTHDGDEVRIFLKLK